MGKHLYRKTCEICGKIFLSKTSVRRRCYEDHYFTCPHCGKSILWNDYRPFVGCKEYVYQVAAEKRKITMQEKYGAPTTLQSKELTAKMKSTMVEKYGVDNPGKSEDLRTKYWKEHYGVENPMQVPEIAKRSASSRMEHIDQVIEHTKQTWMKKYGVDNVFKSPEIQEKIKVSLQEKYGEDHPMKVPEIRKKFEETCKERYGHPYYVLTEEYRKNGYFRVSKINQDFSEKLQSYGLIHNTEYSIDRKSYDFYVLQNHLLIEINPTYTHSIVGSHWNKNGLEKQYHVDKTKLANLHNIECLHVWDWDDWDKVIQLSCPQIKLPCEEFQVFRLNVESCNEFLRQNDYRNVPRNQILCLGLVKDQEIYQVMTFGKAKYQQDYIYQIYRTCTKLNYNIIGGYDKLSSEASKQFDITSCIAYADVSKPWIGQCYKDIGMKLQKRNPPNLLWSKGKEYKWDYIVRTHNTDSESKMIEEGWLPIYDCGTDVYTFK